jgi:hypothetical protein
LTLSTNQGPRLSESGALTCCYTVGVAGFEPTASSSRILGGTVAEVIYAVQEWCEVHRRSLGNGAVAVLRCCTARPLPAVRDHPSKTLTADTRSRPQVRPASGRERAARPRLAPYRPKNATSSRVEAEEPAPRLNALFGILRARMGQGAARFSSLRHDGEVDAEFLSESLDLGQG